MKILFCAYDRPGHIATGPNAWIQRLIPDLINKYDLDITTLFLHHGKKEECPTLAFFVKEGLPIATINIEKIRYTENQVKQILYYIRELNITVLVANLVIPAFYTAKYLAIHNIPVIPVLHSNEPHTIGVIKKFLNKEKSAIINSVSVSTLINSYINPQLTKGIHQVIPCGTPKAPNTPKAAYSSNIKVIYAGRIEVEQKQILLLTKAFIEGSKELLDIDFNIYGNGRYEQEVHELIADNQQTRVCFKGSVAPSEIQQTMAQHNVFTLMSDYEGMPIALMEAMACGLVPVCLNEESGINEIIEDGVNGFIVKDREKDYQDKLRLLQEDPELWKRMSINAILTIEEKYSTEITHKKWADLLLSFKSNVSTQVIIPKKIELEGEPLLYGDNRKPAFIKRVRINIAKQWMWLCLTIRPRARLKAILKK